MGVGDKPLTVVTALATAILVCGCENIVRPRVQECAFLSDIVLYGSTSRECLDLYTPNDGSTETVPCFGKVLAAFGARSAFGSASELRGWVATDSTGFYVEGVLVIEGACTQPIRISSSLVQQPQIAILFDGSRYELVWTDSEGVVARSLSEDGVLSSEHRLTDESLDVQTSLQWIKVTGGRALARERISFGSEDRRPIVTGVVTWFDETFEPNDTLEVPSHRVAIAAHDDLTAVLSQPNDVEPPSVRLFRASKNVEPVSAPVMLVGRFGYASLSATPLAFFVALWKRGIPEQIAIAKLDHDGSLVISPQIVTEGLYPEIASGPSGTIIVFGDRSTVTRDAGYCGSALSAAIVDEDTLSVSQPIVVGSERGEYRDFEVRATRTGFQIGADFVVWYRDGTRDSSVCLAPRFAALDSQGHLLSTFTPAANIANERD